MRQKTITHFLWLLVGSLMLVACNGGLDADEPSPSATARVEAAEATQMPAPQPTEAPTAEPTQLPTPEATQTARTEPTTEAVESVQSMVPYHDDSLGVTFFYPAQWYAEPQQDAVFLFSSQELSDAPTFDEGAALFVFRDDEIGVFGPEAALEVFMSRFNFLENEEVVSGTEALTINQQDAVRTTHQGQFGETTVLVTYTVITREGSSAMTMSITPEETGEAYRAIIGDIVDSVILLGAAGSE